MTTIVRSGLKSKTFSVSKSFIRPIEKETSLVNFKFYQKLIVLLISLSTILIFPESPRELGNICEDYSTRKICNVW